MKAPKMRLGWGVLKNGKLWRSVYASKKSAESGLWPYSQKGAKIVRVVVMVVD